MKNVELTKENIEKIISLKGRHLFMMSRCYNKDDVNYKHYGARGIVVCEEWHQVENYINDMFDKLTDTSLVIDRTNNDGNYEPNNCKCVTISENNFNVRKKHDLMQQPNIETIDYCIELGWINSKTLKETVAPMLNYHTMYANGSYALISSSTKLNVKLNQIGYKCESKEAKNGRIYRICKQR